MNADTRLPGEYPTPVTTDDDGFDEDGIYHSEACPTCGATHPADRSCGCFDNGSN